MRPFSHVTRRTFLQETAATVGGLTFLSGAPAAQPSASGIRSDTRCLVALRVSAEQWLPEDRFNALLTFLAAYRGTVDEVAFFTSSTHPPLPLAEIQHRAHPGGAHAPGARAGHRGGN